VKGGKKSYMYYGTYYHKLEQKDRLSLPAAFRKLLRQGAVITRGLDGCLFVFDKQKWDQTIQTVEKLSFTQKRNRDFVRLLANEAREVEFDTQGRMNIADHLKELANLSKDVVIVGSLDRIEIWDKERYHIYTKGLEQKAEEIAEEITMTMSLPEKGNL